MKSETCALYLNMSLSKAVDGCDDMSWCPTPGCTYAFVKDQSRFDCPLCFKAYCLDCRVEFHKDKTCIEWKAHQVNEKDETELLEQFKNTFKLK
jgi:hypothetical protein